MLGSGMRFRGCEVCRVPAPILLRGLATAMLAESFPQCPRHVSNLRARLKIEAGTTAGFCWRRGQMRGRCAGGASWRFWLGGDGHFVRITACISGVCGPILGICGSRCLRGTAVCAHCVGPRRCGFSRHCGGRGGRRARRGCGCMGCRRSDRGGRCGMRTISFQ